MQKQLRVSLQNEVDCLMCISETNFKSACIVVTCATSYTGEARIDKAKILLLGLAIEND